MKPNSDIVIVVFAQSLIFSGEIVIVRKQNRQTQNILSDALSANIGKWKWICDELLLWVEANWSVADGIQLQLSKLNWKLNSIWCSRAKSEFARLREQRVLLASLFNYSISIGTAQIKAKTHAHAIFKLKFETRFWQNFRNFESQNDLTQQKKKSRELFATSKSRKNDGIQQTKQINCFDSSLFVHS